MADNISKVYEAAVKRKLNVEFLIERADGPLHERHFVVRATVGDHTSEGEGSSIKNGETCCFDQSVVAAGAIS